MFLFLVFCFVGKKKKEHKLEVCGKVGKIWKEVGERKKHHQNISHENVFNK